MILLFDCAVGTMVVLELILVT